jgi:predicted permease
MRSFVRLQSVDLGFDAARVAYAPIRLPRTSYADPARTGQFFTALLDRVRQMPGAPVAALVSSAPFAGPNSGLVYVPTDRPLDARASAPDADYRVVSSGYARALGARLVRGRDFTDADGMEAPPVILVSETFAKRTWPREDPVGKEIRVGDIVKGPLFTVVGVVSDIRYQQLTTDTRAMMYFSALARPQPGMTLVMRGNASALAPAVRAVVSAIDASLPAPAVSAADDLIGAALATPRFAVALFGVFAAAALALATIGIYGVMAYLVRQRMHELGIRIALGAPRRRVVAWVVGSALRMTLVGVALGLFGAWAATRLLSTLLFEVSATDRGTFVGVAALLTLVAVLGSLLPARRATRADPLTVLRMN